MSTLSTMCIKANYFPQTKFAKVRFLLLSVILSTVGGGVCLSACWDTHPPPGRHPLGRQLPGRHPLADTPLEQTPSRRQTPPVADTPLAADTPPQVDIPWANTPLHSACWATSGWYASYWNAYLLLFTCSKCAPADPGFLLE